MTILSRPCYGFDARTHGRVHAIVIGVGNRHEALVEQVRVAGAAEDFTFIDRLPHDQMLAVYRCVDIYVFS